MNDALPQEYFPHVSCQARNISHALSQEYSPRSPTRFVHFAFCRAVGWEGGPVDPQNISRIVAIDRSLYNREISRCKFFSDLFFVESMGKTNFRNPQSPEADAAESEIASKRTPGHSHAPDHFANCINFLPQATSGRTTEKAGRPVNNIARASKCGR